MIHSRLQRIPVADAAAATTMRTTRNPIASRTIIVKRACVAERYQLGRPWSSPIRWPRCSLCLSNLAKHRQLPVFILLSDGSGNLHLPDG